MYLYDDFGRKLKDIPLATRPWGITLLLGTQSAVVTLPEIKAIQFINIVTFAPAKTANVGVWCAGITTVNHLMPSEQSMSGPSYRNTSPPSIVTPYTLQVSL
jgi:hypothetical protein